MGTGTQRLHRLDDVDSRVSQENEMTLANNHVNRTGDPLRVPPTG